MYFKAINFSNSKLQSVLSWKPCKGSIIFQRYTGIGLHCSRNASTRIKRNNSGVVNDLRAKTYLNYLGALVIAVLGAAFTAVPLYTVFCKVTNYAGNVGDRVLPKRDLKRVPERELIISFNADKNARLQWNFRPLQTDIRVVPGETVLAFYAAENPTDKPISGISTYNVIPFEAAQYFNKIQCFCFDEQRLNPKEQVDMPVFFYIDPEYATDPFLAGVNNIMLSYSFFEAREGLELPFVPRN